MDFPGVAVINLLLVMLFYKELRLSTFDPLLAGLFGFMPALIHYVLMTMVSLTVVAFIPSSRRHPRYRPHDRTCGYRLFMDGLCESHAH